MTGTGTTFKDNNEQWSHLIPFHAGSYVIPKPTRNQNEITRRFVMKKCFSHFFLYLPSFTTSDFGMFSTDQFSRQGSEKYLQLKRMLHRKPKKSNDLWKPFDIHSTFGITFKLQLEESLLLVFFFCCSFPAPHPTNKIDTDIGLFNDFVTNFFFSTILFAFYQSSKI